ncbi:histidine kinase [Dactylosporangium sp. AC04546]|uniref:sensor histidine kinase n=1 Tax=Dactylosporangium sp. AC04546 TaxID=2862460 RepID=UPI002E7BB459|nr:histidine kinase [Dactylosporangium sp. AC04546]WVK85964.1 histidine kinase [Dactylosporangium sp. AC04546]
MSVLVRGSTYRRGVFLLLGGVLLLPYALLVAAFARAFAEPGAPRAVIAALAAVTAAIGLVPPFLRGTRALEITAARWLLGADLPDPVPAAEGGETRMRSALWFVLHLAIGGAVGLGVLVAVPLAVAALLQPGRGGLGLTAAGLAALVGLVFAVAGLGALATTMAPVLLGPSATARIAALEAQAVRLAERNRLARELHDSVGHALTVTTLQAAAARQRLREDPAFAERALGAIEDAARSALTDLDAVLGVLRDDTPAALAPSRSLRDLPRLVEEAGVTVELHTDGALDDVPSHVSREGYRIVQESLTNAMRHAGGGPVAVRVSATGGTLEVDVLNKLDGRRSPRDRARGASPDEAGQPGRGLRGMAERVTLLGGGLDAGPVDGAWRVSARLPYGEAA